jgi:DNA (cytosine-5)-methyltransferase 1
MTAVTPETWLRCGACGEVYQDAYATALNDATLCPAECPRCGDETHQCLRDATLTFGSVCSGIEAASVAWEPLGFWAEWFAEIEAFPSAVLAHHWPDVPNYGDMLKLPALVDAGKIAAPDVLVGGTPCQAFSVAGNRESLADARGGLTLAYVELADAIDRQRARDGAEPCVVVWENVPGVLSTKDNAFGCFLAGLAGEDVPLLPPGKRWTNAGLVLGPKRAVAWRILDAQYFGLAQRRRRVFVVASARDRFDPSAILLEFDGLRRDSAPRREARQDAAADAGRRAAGTGSHWDAVTNPHPSLNQSHNTGGIGASNQEVFSQRGAGLVQAAYQDVAHCLNAGGMGRIDYETESFVVNAAIPILEPGARTGKSTTDTRAGSGIGADGDPMFTLQAGKQHGVACVSVTGDIAHTLNTANNGKGCSEDGTGRGVPTIAHTVALRGREGGGAAEIGGEVATALRASGGGGDKAHVLTLGLVDTTGHQGDRFVASGDVTQALSASAGNNGGGGGTCLLAPEMAVRRLTPRECERLQGFPDDHTMIPAGQKLKGEIKEELARYFDRTGQYMREVSSGQWEFDRAAFEAAWPAMAADGPRYKALGNSMAVPVMRWIGQRIIRHLNGEI